MSNELALNEVMVLGKSLAESGYFKDAKQASQAIVKVLAGQELGIGPVASMSAIHIIQGNVTLSSNVMASLVKASLKYHYKVLEHDSQLCAIQFLENGEPIGISEYTMEDAKQADLEKKDVWKKNPKNMLFARAMSNGFKWFCPDLANGQSVYTPDELQEEEDFTIEMPELLPVASEPDNTPKRIGEVLEDKGRNEWLKAIMKHKDYPADGTPKAKADFINAQFDEKELGLAAVTIPEVMTLSK